MGIARIKINRAPLLTLWAVVVAERLGYGKETALTLGKAVAALNAQAKGRRIGIYEAKSDAEKAKARRKEMPVGVEYINILGRGVPVPGT